ncbi:hypothetical protein PLICRDRAFT_27328 [Plicaturopsis crispa FD-325 SS-3]|nr:hypothetical protein PLICRDRAFT_27328 [Plicaturopsis crispa FD-325 SS-3]
MSAPTPTRSLLGRFGSGSTPAGRVLTQPSRPGSTVGNRVSQPQSQSPDPPEFIPVGQSQQFSMELFTNMMQDGSTEYSGDGGFLQNTQAGDAASQTEVPPLQHSLSGNLFAGPHVPQIRRHDGDGPDRRAAHMPGIPTHQLRAHAQRRAQEDHLTLEQTAAVVATSERTSVQEMLVDLRVHLFQHENDVLARFIKLYLRHPDFQMRLKHNIAAALLSCNVQAYLKGMLDQMLEHFEKNLGLLGLAPAVRQDPVDWGFFGQQLELSVKKNDDIYVLTRALLIYDIRPKAEHWGRVAFLKPTFWEYVDSELQATRAELKQHTDAVKRKQEEAIVFANILAMDLAKFKKGSNSVRSKQVYTDENVSEWQKNMEQAVEAFAVDDEVEDTEDVSAAMQE